MLRLSLLRHGKAANPEKYDEDYDRPLNKKGVAQINQVGHFLKNEGNEASKIDQIISSSAQRTKETAQIANSFLHVEDISFHDQLYLAPKDVIQENITKLAKAETVLYVGHNFGISDIATYLSGERISMNTGMIIQFEFDLDDWNMITAGSGTITHTLNPQVYIP